MVVEDAAGVSLFDLLRFARGPRGEPGPVRDRPYGVAARLRSFGAILRNAPVRSDPREAVERLIHDEADVVPLTPMAHPVTEKASMPRVHRVCWSGPGAGMPATMRGSEVSTIRADCAGGCPASSRAGVVRAGSAVPWRCGRARRRARPGDRHLLSLAVLVRECMTAARTPPRSDPAMASLADRTVTAWKVSIRRRPPVPLG